MVYKIFTRSTVSWPSRYLFSFHQLRNYLGEKSIAIFFSFFSVFFFSKNVHKYPVFLARIDHFAKVSRYRFCTPWAGRRRLQLWWPKNVLKISPINASYNRRQVYEIFEKHQQSYTKKILDKFFRLIILPPNWEMKTRIDINKFICFSNYETLNQFISNQSLDTCSVLNYLILEGCDLLPEQKMVTGDDKTDIQNLFNHFPHIINFSETLRQFRKKI